VQWAPGIPTIASLQAPEYLPDDKEAPRVNRDRRQYAKALVDLVEQLMARFDLEEVEFGLRMPGTPWPGQTRKRKSASKPSKK
jgi:hypothetical protein